MLEGSISDYERDVQEENIERENVRRRITSPSISDLIEILLLWNGFQRF